MGDGQSAGMMTLAHLPLATEIRRLATHPGTSGVGQTMIEKAVNESQAAGNYGVVRVSSLDDTSEGFYNSTGFQAGEDDYMKLDPSKSGVRTQQRRPRFLLCPKTPLPCPRSFWRKRLRDFFSSHLRQPV